MITSLSFVHVSVLAQCPARAPLNDPPSQPPNYDDHAPPNYGPPHLAGQRAHRVESIGGLCFHAQHKPPRLHDLNGRGKCQVALFIIVIIIIIIVIVIGVACSCNLAWMGHRRHVSRIHCACSFIHSFIQGRTQPKSTKIYSHQRTSASEKRNRKHCACSIIIVIVIGVACLLNLAFSCCSISPVVPECASIELYGSSTYAVS